MTIQTEYVQVFISHTSKDRGFMNQICEHLQLLGIPIWYSPVEIPSKGQMYTDRELEYILEKAIKESSHFLLLLDDHFISSKWVQYEVDTITRVAVSETKNKIIPILNHPITLPIPKFLHERDIIDFNRGYYTALSQLIQKVAPDTSNLSFKDLARAISEGSRTFENETPLSEHIETLDMPREVARFVKMARNAFSEWDQARPIVDDFLTIADSLDGRLGFDQVFCGNSILGANTETGGISLTASHFPIITQRMAGMYGPNFKRIPLSDIFFTVWRTDDPQNIDYLCTVAAQYWNERGAFLWLAYKDKLWRYSLGMHEEDSYLLINTDREMGSAKYGFLMNLYEPPKLIKEVDQQANNLVGLGQLLKNDADLQTFHPSFKPIIQKVFSQKWELPEGDPNTLFWGHLTHGGILSYSITNSFFSTFHLATQLNHILKCAGAVIREAEFPDNPNKKQYLSISELQDAELQ